MASLESKEEERSTTVGEGYALKDTPDAQVARDVSCIAPYEHVPCVKQYSNGEHDDGALDDLGHNAWLASMTA